MLRDCAISEETSDSGSAVQLMEGQQEHFPLDQDTVNSSDSKWVSDPNFLWHDHDLGGMIQAATTLWMDYTQPEVVFRGREESIGDEFCSPISFNVDPTLQELPAVYLIHQVCAFDMANRFGARVPLVTQWKLDVFSDYLHGYLHFEMLEWL